MNEPNYSIVWKVRLLGLIKRWPPLKLVSTKVRGFRFHAGAPLVSLSLALLPQIEKKSFDIYQAFYTMKCTFCDNGCKSGEEKIWYQAG